MTIGIRLLQISLVIKSLAPDTRGWLDAEKIETVGDLYDLVTDKKRWPCGNVIGADKIAIDEYIELNRATIEAVTEPTKERAEEKPQKITPKMSKEEWDKVRLERLGEMDELANKVVAAELKYNDAKEKAKSEKKKWEKLRSDHFAMSRQISQPQAFMDFDAPAKAAPVPDEGRKTPLQAICDDAGILKALKAAKLETIGGLLMWVESVRKSGGMELKLAGINDARLIALIAAAEQYGKPVAAPKAKAVASEKKAEKERSKHVKILRTPTGTTIQPGEVLKVAKWKDGNPFVEFESNVVIIESGSFEEVAAA